MPRLGPYEIDSLLARGNMGAIYRAHHVDWGREVAIKVILGLAGREERIRFEREARAVAALDLHPNIVRIHSFGTTPDDSPYYAMDLIDGESLRDRIRRTGPLDPKAAVRLFLPICSAVGFAHDEGILHRDLKPANIMVTRDGTPVLTDFGLARYVDGGTRLTHTGDIIGTPYYMAPEQATGDIDRQGPETDIHALGAILFYLLTGLPPFQGTTATEILRAVIWQDPPGISDLNPDVPPALDRICRKAMAKDVGQRYASAEALEQDLQRFLDGETVKARMSRPGLRRSLLAGGLLLLGLLLIGGFLYFGEGVPDEAEQTLATWREKVDGVLKTSRRQQEGKLLELLPTLKRLARSAPDAAEADRLHQLQGMLGMALLEAGHPAEARAPLEQAVATGEEPRLLLALARALGEEAPERAAELYDRAVEAGAGRTGRRARARFHLKLGNRKQALADLRALAREKNPSPEDCLTCARLLLEEKAPRRAERYVSRALEIDAELGKAYLLRARCRKALGRIGPAETDLDVAIRLNTPGARLVRADLLLDTHRLEAAWDAYEELAPDQPEARLMAALCRLWLDRPGASEGPNGLLTLAEEDPNPDRRARAAFWLGIYGQRFSPIAFDHFQAARKDRRKDGRILGHLARMQLERDPGEAFETALVGLRTPTPYPSLIDLARLAGQRSGENFRYTWPGSHRRLANVLGDLPSDRRKVGQAILERARQHRPNGVDVHIWLARDLLETHVPDHLEEARRLYREAYRRDAAREGLTLSLRKAASTLLFKAKRAPEDTRRTLENRANRILLMARSWDEYESPHLALRRNRLLHKRHNYEDALKETQLAAPRLNPIASMFHLETMRGYNPEYVRQVLRRHDRYHPDFVALPVLLERVRHHLKQEELEPARRVLEEARRLNPHDPRLLGLLLSCLRRMKEAEAESDIQKIEKRLNLLDDPERRHHHYDKVVNRARAMAHDGNLNESMKLYREVTQTYLSIQPVESGETSFRLGEILMKKGRTGEAFIALSRAMLLGEQTSGGLFAKMTRSDFTKAAPAAIKKARKREGWTPTLPFARAVRTLTDADATEDALLDGVADCSTALLFHPTSVNLYAIRGLLQLRRGRHLAALQDFELALLGDDKHPLGHLGRSICAFRSGRVETSREALDAAIEGSEGSVLPVASFVGSLRQLVKPLLKDPVLADRLEPYFKF